MANFWAVQGMDALYEGLHGMQETDVIEGTEQEAIETALEMADSVVNDYSCICEEIEEGARETIPDGADFEEYLEECKKEDRLIYYYKLDKDKLPTLDVTELAGLFYNDPDDFIERYSVEEE